METNPKSPLAMREKAKIAQTKARDFVMLPEAISYSVEEGERRRCRRIMLSRGGDIGVLKSDSGGTSVVIEIPKFKFESNA